MTQSPRIAPGTELSSHQNVTMWTDESPAECGQALLGSWRRIAWEDPTASSPLQRQKAKSLSTLHPPDPVEAVSEPPRQSLMQQQPGLINNTSCCGSRSCHAVCRWGHRPRCGATWPRSPPTQPQAPGSTSPVRWPAWGLCSPVCAHSPSQRAQPPHPIYGPPSYPPLPVSPHPGAPGPLKLPQGGPLRVCREREGVIPKGRNGDRWAPGPAVGMGVGVPISSPLSRSCRGESLWAPGLWELPDREGL